MDSEDRILVKLFCSTCDNIDCQESIGYVYDGSEKGCNRWLPEETYARYEHYMAEVIPFWKTYQKEHLDKSYKEVIKFLEKEVYSTPIVAKRDHKGYVVSNKGR